MSQRSLQGRKKRLDGRLLRASGASAMARGTDGQRENLSGSIAAWRRQGTPGRSGPPVAFLWPKPPLGSFIKAVAPARQRVNAPLGAPETLTGSISQGVSRLFRGQPRRFGFGQRKRNPLLALAPAASAEGLREAQSRGAEQRRRTEQCQSVRAEQSSSVEFSFQLD